MEEQHIRIAEDKVAGSAVRWQAEVPQIRPDGLQLEENRTFQERFWLAERSAWLVFVVFVLMALLGLTGAGGVFSNAAKLSDDAKIQLPAVARWQTSDRITITFDRPIAEHSVVFSAAFAEAFQVEDVQPEPVETSLADGGQKLVFLADDQRGAVTIDFRAQSPGRKSFEVIVDGGRPLRLSTFVLP